MTGRCSREGCFAPEVTCQIGEPNHAACPNWAATSIDPDTAEQTPHANVDGFPVPWSGNALGLVDLPFVSTRGNPRIVAIVGAAGAGKTTVLSAFYLLLARGEPGMNVDRFCGSYSLGGWENIAHTLRWANDGGPSFPPHTSSGAGRAPGLLHLGFRCGNAGIQDVLFADSPGEWFRTWAIQRDAPEAEGARWLEQHADVFLLIADCEALSGKELGLARQQFQAIAQRLATDAKGRPTTLVWTKADKPVRTEVEQTINSTVERHFGPIPSFRVSVYPDASDTTTSGFAKLFSWVLSAEPSRLVPVANVSSTSDPFLAYGRF